MVSRLRPFLPVSMLLMCWKETSIISASFSCDTIELTQIASALGTTADALLMMNNHINILGNLSLIERIADERTREKAELIQSAIDEIRFLEELTQSR